MKLTWMGTATVRIETEKERILFDPFYQLQGGEHPNRLEDFLEDDLIFITHGHFDHLSMIPSILDEGDATVFCTRSPVKILEQFQDDMSNVVEICPGQQFTFRDVQVNVLEGQHIHFDKKLIWKTLRPMNLLRHASNVPLLMQMNRQFPEKNETVAYSIEAEGKIILLLGSMGLKDGEAYPVQPDLLVLPFQGSSYLEEDALRIIGCIQPKRILLTHFDDAYPPLSKNVDTRKFKKIMDERYPEIKVVKPKAGVQIFL